MYYESKVGQAPIHTTDMANIIYNSETFTISHNKSYTYSKTWPLWAPSVTICCRFAKV